MGASAGIAVAPSVLLLLLRATASKTSCMFVLTTSSKSILALIALQLELLDAVLCVLRKIDGVLYMCAAVCRELAAGTQD